MSQEVWITDRALVCAPDSDAQALWQQLMQGQTAVRRLTRFDPTGYGCDVAGWIQGLEGASPALIPLLERLLDQLGPVPVDALLVTATTKGDIAALEQGRALNSGQAETLLLERPLGYICQRLGLRDRGVNINAACASATMALGYAFDCITLGKAEVVLVCCFDTFNEFVFSGFAGLRALSAQPCRPFDAERDGLSLGEGAAALLLMHPQRALLEKRSPVGSLVGWGAASDAVHLTAPARDGRGLIRAIQVALARGELDSSQIAAIIAHGTGTRYNDAMELTAFNTVFEQTPVPVNSLKGAIGHTLGAAGGIEAVIATLSLEEKCLPPTVGLQKAADAGTLTVSAQPQAIQGRYLLSTNSGFGGINAALIFGNPF